MRRVNPASFALLLLVLAMSGLPDLEIPAIPPAVLREAFTRFHDRIVEVGLNAKNMPSSSSQAMSEFNASHYGDQLPSAWALGSMLIEHGFDHLNAFVKLTTDPVDPIATATNTRSMLEACAVSAWLLDPSIAAAMRTDRFYAYRISGQDELVKLMRSLRADPQQIADRLSHIEQIKADALRHGCAKMSSDGTKIQLNMRMPDATSLIALHLEEEYYYRLLSGVAHGHFWALTYAGFIRGGESVHMGEMATSLLRAPKPEVIALLAYVSARAIIRSIWNICIYFDWDKMKVEEAIEDLADAVNMSDNFRYWRTQ